jgi:membrane-associated protease RseP (regulator of RpoE activity)
LGIPFVCLFFVLSLFDGAKYPLMLVLAVLIHELGHILAARLVRAPLASFSCGLHGFSMAFDFTSLSFGKECFVLLAGSGLGLTAAALALGQRDSFAYFSAVSAALSLLNLLPIRGLDGGAALSCVLDHFLLPDRSYKIAKMISWCAALFFWLSAVWIQLRIHPNLSLLAASFYFLWRSASD